MEIRPFHSGDVPAFLALAAAEGWVSDPWEFAFLRGSFPQGCLAVEEEGGPVAFVTAVRYGTSGWIGNLIVARGYRGRGYGTLLMNRAKDVLLASGVTTAWLTASREGRPIYGRMGFREIDRVARWQGRGKGKGEGFDRMPLGRLAAIDRAGWGDDRQVLLTAVVSRGALLCGTESFLIVQRSGSGVQFGPWSGCDRDDASALLGRALGAVGKGVPVLVDVPTRNSAATALLGGAGFTVRGDTSLMYAGAEPEYNPARVFALASMGSMG